MSRSGLGSPEVWEREIGKRGGVHASRRRLFVTYVHSVLAFRSSGSSVTTEFPHSNSSVGALVSDCCPTQHVSASEAHS